MAIIISSSLTDPTSLPLIGIEMFQSGPVL